MCGPTRSALGGGPTHVRNLLASPLKDRFSLVHFETGSRGAESPARDEAWPRTLLRLVTSPVALAWRLLRSRPAVVHLNSAMDQRAFWRDAAYLCVARLLGSRVLLQLHGGSLRTLCAPPGMRGLVRRMYSAPDALVSLASSEKQELEALGVAARLSIIPNGIDVSQYGGAPAERAHGGQVRRLAFMGRLVRPKGIFEAMEAVRLLRSESGFRDLELWIAGSGPARDEIERWIRENTMAPAVRLVGSVQDQAKVDFLKEADVFVFPSHGEGLPYAVLESLAAGTPVIATRVGGIPDVVIDRVHGILVDPRSPGQIVDAIREMARSEEALRAMARACRDRAAQEFGLDKLAARFEALYQRLGASGAG